MDMKKKKKKSAAGGRPNSEPGQIPLVHPAGQLTTTLLVTKGKLKQSYSSAMLVAASISRVAKGIWPTH